LKIRRVHFKSFGIFREQTLEDIHPGLVVIAGPNRAGKTTFMTALRYLGYGLPPKGIIPPPPTGQHDFNADVELDNGSLHNISILGYSKPKVSPLCGGKEISIEEIFNVDGFTYRQVFTISLDELKQLPEGLKSKDEQYLQVVLLGGGWSDALRLTRIREELEKKAYAIGRTRGAKNVGQFKNYWETIKEGINERNEANKQLELYYLKKRELDELCHKTIPELEKILEEKRRLRERLEILKDHYDSYEQWAILSQKIMQPHNRHLLDTYPEGGLDRAKELREKYAACILEYQNYRKKFDAAVGMDKLNAFIDHADTLEAYRKQLSGWKEKVNAYLEKKQSHQNEQDELEQKMKRLNTAWGGDLKILDSIKLDLVKEESLHEAIENFRASNDRIREIKCQKKQLQLKIKKKEEQKRNLGDPGGKFPRGFTATIGLGVVLILLISFIFRPTTVLAAGMVMASGIIAYFFWHHSKNSQVITSRNAIDREITALKDEMTSLEAEEMSLTNTLGELTDRLKEIKRDLKLEENVPSTRLMDIYREIKNLRERYIRWNSEYSSLKQQREKLVSLLSEIRSTLDMLKLNTFDFKGEEDIIDTSGEIFDAVDKAGSYLELARKLSMAAGEKAGLEKNIIDLLKKENPLFKVSFPEADDLQETLVSFIKRGELFEKLKQDERLCSELRQALLTSLNTERRRVLLQDLNSKSASDGEWLLEAFGRLFNAYASKTEVASQLNHTCNQIEDLEKQIENAKERKTILELEIENLASDTKLREAYRKIYTAKKGMEKLAEQYAVLKLAAMLVEGVHKSLIENTRASLLNSASTVFSKITSGEYEEILLTENDLPAGFKVKAAESKNELTANSLSRATKEQLFLSVRLSRIRGIKPPLPVIFDDSLVNFDPNHGRQAAQIIAELAQTHQVFVLTCHPELVKYLKSCTRSAQYWSLKKGKFRGPYDSPAEILKLLNA